MRHNSPWKEQNSASAVMLLDFKTVSLASLEPFKQTHKALGCCCSLDLQFAFQALANLYKTEVTAGRIKAERSSLAGLHSLSSQFKSGTGW